MAVQRLAHAELVKFTLLTFPFRFLRALKSGTFLLPLPVYWSHLSALDWRALSGDDEDDHNYAPAVEKYIWPYIRLRNMAHFSSTHLEMLERFMRSGAGEPVPARPSWLQF